MKAMWLVQPMRGRYKLNTTPIVFAYPGDINTQSGGYGYDRRILREWERLGHPIKLEGVGDDYPRPTRSTRDAALARLMKQPIGWPMIVDGLAFAAFGNRAAALADRHPLVALVHHPVGLETGLDRDTSRKLIADETAALAAAHRVIVTSPTTARTLTDKFGVAAERITVARPGVDTAPYSDPRDSGPIRMVSVGALIPRKGFDILIRALSRLTDLDWRLTIIGSDQADPEYAAELKKLVVDLDLSSRITLTGVLPNRDVTYHYMTSELFVLASHYEGYGMAYAEAIAHGLPVVGTTGGAIGETVPAAAARLVQPGRVLALGDTLRELIIDRANLSPLREAARAAAPNLPRWEETARLALAAVTQAIEDYRVAAVENWA